jgi:hypothetical protein
LHILYKSDGYLLCISRRTYSDWWHAGLRFSYILYLAFYIWLSLLNLHHFYGLSGSNFTPTTVVPMLPKHDLDLSLQCKNYTYNYSRLLSKRRVFVISDDGKSPNTHQ